MSASLKKFWDFESYQEKQWFRLLGMSLFSLATIYILLHLLLSRSCETGNAFEYTKLDPIELQQINRIYFDNIPNDTSAKKTSLIPIADTTKKSSIKQPASAKKNKDTKNKDTVKSHVNNNKKSETNEVKNNKDSVEITAKCASKKDSCKCLSFSKPDRVIQYLKTEFIGLDTAQLDTIKAYLDCAKPTEATAFLLNVKLKTHSCFWLSGPYVYLEIIFWTLFGVLCSLIFNVGVVAKSSTNNRLNRSSYFDPTEIPSQIAKIFYAPLFTIAIVLGYKLLASQNLADITTGKGVLLFGFVGGYYSSRLISFLDRFKDLLLPNNGSADVPKIDQPPLKNILIAPSFDLSPAGLPNTPLLGDISKTKITLTNKKTGQITTVSNISGNPAIFIADFVLPASYAIDASLEVKDSTGAMINLKNSKDVVMKTVDLFIPIALN